MPELKHTIGPVRARIIPTEAFLTWAEDVKGITPETVGEYLAVAEMYPPQRGWYGDAYVKLERQRIEDAIAWLRIIADEYLNKGRKPRRCVNEVMHGAA